MAARSGGYQGSSSPWTSAWDYYTKKTGGGGGPKGNITYRDRNKKKTPGPLSSYKSVTERNIPTGKYTIEDPENEVDWYSLINFKNGNMPPGYPPSGPGPSGGRYGGGGGGGLSATQQAAMGRLLGKGPAQYQFTAFDAPEYTPFTPGPRDTRIYDQARLNIGRGAEEDRGRTRQLYGDLIQRLGTQENVLANPRMQMSPEFQNAYSNLIGGGAANQVVSEENAFARNADTAYGGLMQLLAAQEARNMQSREREAMQDQLGALSNISAQERGMLGGVEMADLQDARDFQRYVEQIEREEGRYLSERELNEAMMNWQGANQAQQANVGIQNDWTQGLFDLIPLLDDAGLLEQIGA